MKKSEELMSLASKEDNDIISFALQCKALREKRIRKVFRRLASSIRNKISYRV